MIRLAWRTARADLRASWQRALLIGVILLAACATLMLALTLFRGAEAPWDRAFAQANGAHVTFYAWSGGPGAADGTTAAQTLPDLTALGTAPGVSAASATIPGLDEVPLVANGSRHTLSLQAPDSLPVVNTPLLTSGRWLSGAAGEIVLNRSVARAAGVNVGDTLTLSSGGEPLTLRVVGTAVSPWRELYPAASGLSWLALADLRTLEPDTSRWYVTLGVRLTDATDSVGVEQAAHALLDNRNVAGISRGSWQDTRADVTEWNRINAGFLGMFSLVALLAAALVTTNVVAARVLAQARQIGLLKAVGVTPLGVVGTFLVQHLIIALVAALGGVGVGLAVAPLFLRRLANALQTTATPVWNAEILLIAAVIVVSAMVVVTLATVVPALRAGRQTTVRTLTGGVAPTSGVVGSGRGSRLARLAARLHLPLVVQLGLKDTFTRPGRAALTIGALTISLVTIIFSLGAQATFDRINDEPALQGEPFDLDVRRRDMPAADALAVLTSNPDVASVYPRAAVQAQITRQPRTSIGETAADLPPQPLVYTNLGPQPATYLVRAIEGDPQQAGFLIASNRGRMPRQPGEAVAGWGLFNALHLQVGDTLDVTVNGRTIPVTLVGQFLEDDNDGEVLMLSMETARQLLPEIQPSTYLVHLSAGASGASGSDGEAVALSLLQASDYQFDIWTRADETASDADSASIQGVFSGLGLTLAFVGLINLIATTMITVRERLREYAILRAVGLTPTQITLVVGSSVALLAALAGVIGVPLGMLVSRAVYYGVLQRNLGLLPEWFTSPAWWQLLALTPALVLTALVAGALPARQATRIDIAQALRAE